MEKLIWEGEDGECAALNPLMLYSMPKEAGMVHLRFYSTVAQLLAALPGSPKRVVLYELKSESSIRWKRITSTWRRYALGDGRKYRALYARVNGESIDIAYVKE